MKKNANIIQSSFEDRFLFKNIKFSQLNNLKLKNENIRGVIFDLGYSLNQIKDPKKGLSFETVGALNMKMGINEFSAKEAINILDKVELAQIFKYFGEEKDSNRIAHNIVEDRSKKEIKETPPSRSAKLRYVIKKEDFYDFETDILEKFDHLIKIENFSQKL